MPKPVTKTPTPYGARYSTGVVGFVGFDGMPGAGGDELRNVLDHVVERDPTLFDEYQHDRIPAVRRKTYLPQVSAAMGRAFDQMRLAKTDILQADARLMEAALPVEPVIAQDYVDAARCLSASTQPAWVEQADLTALTAVVARGNVVPFVEATWERAVERFWLLNWVEKFNAAAGNPARASLDTILATGSDQAAMMAEAEKYRADHLENLASIERMEATAKDMIHFLAAMFDMSAQAALDAALKRVDEAA